MGIREHFRFYLDKHLSENEKNFYLDDIFLQHIYDLPLKESHVGNICEAIISAQTDLEKAYRGLKKPEIFKHQPLQNLYKVHCEIVTPQQISMNIFHKNDIFYVNDELHLSDQEFEKIIQRYKQGDDLDTLINNYMKEKFSKLDHKARSNRKTGFWLIYGKNKGVNHYLYLDLEYSHSVDRDKEIYQTLVSLYSKEKIELLKSGK